MEIITRRQELEMNEVHELTWIRDKRTCNHSIQLSRKAHDNFQSGSGPFLWGQQISGPLLLTFLIHLDTNSVMWDRHIFT